MSDSSRCSTRFRLLPKLDVNDSLGLWSVARDMVVSKGGGVKRRLIAYTFVKNIL